MGESVPQANCSRWYSRPAPEGATPGPFWCCTDLILLDLNLPKIDGREVLAQIKGDDSLKTIPTVILTTSDAQADITKTYQFHANCYLTKPVRLDAFEILVKSINDFWVTKSGCRTARRSSGLP